MAYSRQHLPRLLGPRMHPLVTVEPPNYAGNLADEARRAWINISLLTNAQSIAPGDELSAERAIAVDAERQIVAACMKLLALQEAVA